MKFAVNPKYFLTIYNVKKIGLDWEQHFLHNRNILLKEQMQMFKP